LITLSGKLIIGLSHIPSLTLKAVLKYLQNGLLSYIQAVRM